MRHISIEVHGLVQRLLYERRWESFAVHGQGLRCMLHGSKSQKRHSQTAYFHIDSLTMVSRCVSWQTAPFFQSHPRCFCSAPMSLNEQSDSITISTALKESQNRFSDPKSFFPKLFLKGPFSNGPFEFISQIFIFRLKKKSFLFLLFIDMIMKP